MDTSWPNFKSDAPPRDWELHHNRAGRMTIHESCHGYTAQDWKFGGHDNRVIPRRANHHYYRDIHGGTDYYFA